MTTGEAPFQWIVVPLDGSPFGEQALPYARQLARGLNLPVLLVSAAHIDTLAATDGAGMGTAASGEVLAMLIDQEIEAVRNYLDGVKQQLEAESITVETRADYGFPVGFVREAINDKPGSLVVMSSHGRGGAVRMALGSVADQLVRDSGRPVIVVRPEPHDAAREEEPIRRVLVALDGSALSEESLGYARAIATALGAALTILRVAETEAETAGARQYLETVAKSFGDGGAAPDLRVWVSRPAEGILDCADEVKADLIALTTHGRTGLSRWLTGSTTDRVLTGTRLPLLVIRGHRGAN